LISGLDEGAVLGEVSGCCWRTLPWENEDRRAEKPVEAPENKKILRRISVHGYSTAQCQYNKEKQNRKSYWFLNNCTTKRLSHTEISSTFIHLSKKNSHLDARFFWCFRERVFVTFMEFLDFWEKLTNSLGQDYE
jgi:hypothetical protein